LLRLNKLLIAVAVAASAIYVAGCSLEPYQDEGVVQSEYSQPSPQARPQQSQTGYRDVTPEQAKQLIDNDKTIQIIDVREEYEYAGGYIPGTKLIPISQFISRMGEIDKTRPVFIYCAVGSRSRSAAQVLTQSGYTNVYNLSGGVARWPYELQK